jgi:hypothetical protein
MAQSRDSERLVDTLCREVGLFEEKVVSLQEKCSQVRDCIAALCEKLRQSRSLFPPHGGDRQVSGRGTGPEKLSAAEIAEACGIKDHVEQARSSGGADCRPDLIVHEPDDRIIIIDCQLTGCGLTGLSLREMVGSRLRELAAMPEPGPERADCARILYVPTRLDPAACAAAEESGVTIASPADLLIILGTVALRWLTCTCGQKARSVVDQGQDLVDVMSTFISDFTETEKLLCELVNDCALASRNREQSGAPMHA